MNRLMRFREKRDEWLLWLENDEHHAISKQILEMLWSDAVFRLINNSRKYAQKAGGGFATQSGVIASALTRGYLAEQLIAIRRLLEPANRQDAKQVISLRRLIDDLKAHRTILTREMFVCHDGLPFDGAAGFIEDNPPGGGDFWGDTSGPRAFVMSDVQHEYFDGMMDTPRNARSRRHCRRHILRRHREDH